jgi:predicted transport protein
MASPDDAMKNMIRNLEEKTGKKIEEWVKLAKASGSEKHGEIVKHLKTEHALGHGYANMIAHTALQSASMHADEGDLIAAQYSGAKSALRPVYDKLLAEVQKFGTDVEVSPKKAYVSLRRKKQFAIIQPSTATRVDVGINLKGTPATDRLEESGSFNAMVSHRVRLASAKDVDKELMGWLLQAYESS